MVLVRDGGGGEGQGVRGAAQSGGWGRGLKRQSEGPGEVRLVSIPLSGGSVCLLVTNERMKRLERTPLNRPQDNCRLLAAPPGFLCLS